MQFYVRDRQAAVSEFCSRFGFVELCTDHLDTRLRISRSTVLGQGSIVVVLTEPFGPGPGQDFLTAYGDGLARIGFSCVDLRDVYARAVAAGARALEPPRRFGSVWMAALGGVGDLVHTLVEQPPRARTLFLPAIGCVPRAPTYTELGLLGIDHFAVGVSRGEMDRVAKQYQAAWAFEPIRTECTAMEAYAGDSITLGSPGREVVLTLIETPRTPSDQSCIWHYELGVRHMALRTDDLVATVQALEARGVRVSESGATHDHRLQRRDVRDGLSHDGEWYGDFARNGSSPTAYITEVIERNSAGIVKVTHVTAFLEAEQRELAESAWTCAGP